MLRARANGETFVSTAMCPPVCQGLKNGFRPENIPGLSRNEPMEKLLIEVFLAKFNPSSSKQALQDTFPVDCGKLTS